MNKIVSKYTHRLLARFIVEAETPLKIGRGEKDIITDALVAVDVNGLPYLPGTSIAGVVRSMLDPDKKNLLFGYQTASNSQGSEIIFSEGRVLNSKGQVMDGIRPELIENNLKDPVLDVLKYELPVRQHARIGHRGVTMRTGKFDEQVVLQGTRFCFEMEIVADQADTKVLETLLQTVCNRSFRMGGGTRKGFGALKVISLKSAVLDLRNDMDLYLQKSSQLEKSGFWTGWKEQAATTKLDEGWITYTLTLKPQDFLFMGSGYADPDGDADMTTVKARRIDWSKQTAEIEEDQVLIPATSLKGALRHRTVYHYNKATGIYAEPGVNMAELAEPEAIDQLFGAAHGDQLSRGNVILNDIIEAPSAHKLMNHVSIDRFTGGTIDGALFSEQVDYVAGRSFTTQILIRKVAVNDASLKAFEAALNDLVTGLLPLGGGINRGHGVFTGTITKN